MHFSIGTVQIARKAEYASLAANRGSTYCRTPTEICHRRISLAAYFYVRSVNSVFRLHKSVGEKLIYCRKAQKVAASVAGNHGEVVGNGLPSIFAAVCISPLLIASLMRVELISVPSNSTIGAT